MAGADFYYYRREGRNLRIHGQVGSVEWHESYTAIHQSFETETPAGGPKPAEDIFSEVVRAYRATARWANLKKTTQDCYDIQIRRLLAVFGDVSIRQINARHISELRDKIAGKSLRQAKECLKVLRVIFKIALERAIIKQNPAAGVEDPVGYKAVPWRPWTQDEIKLFKEKARPVWRRAMMVLLYIGQRRADVVKLRRDSIKDGMIEGFAEKTQRTVFIPIHRELEAELATPLPVESMFLVCGERGQKIAPSWLSHGIAKEFKRLGVDDSPPLHGLRKNAVMALIEAGSTEEEVHAITAQSKEMVMPSGPIFLSRSSMSPCRYSLAGRHIVHPDGRRLALPRCGQGSRHDGDRRLVDVRAPEEHPLRCPGLQE